MPKHTQRFDTPSHHYVHPSLRTSSHGSVAVENKHPEDVNERLARLRQVQSLQPSAAQKQAIVDVVTHRTVPPSLRNLLDIPETAAPRPKAGTRMRPSRTPGPAAPKSWLAGGGLEEARLKERRENARLACQRHGELGRRSPLRFGLLAPKQEGSRRKLDRKSLVHLALKSMAENWDSVIIAEQYNLAALPVQTKSWLLSHICIYGPDVIDINTLKVLFLTESELPGSTGSEEVSWLDFSGLLNSSFTLRKLKNYFLHRGATESSSVFPVLSERSKISIGDENTRPRGDDLADILDKKLAISPSTELKSSINRVKETEQSSLASWEEEFERETQSFSSPVTPLRFPQLTRLSLAHPGSSVSWADLLSLSPYLATLTHLSLAYWPTPSLTPNSITSAVDSPHGPSVRYGGTDFYSAFDNDWAEAANILRRLSNNTYCLKWLDLEGCTEWVSALAWPFSHNDPVAVIPDSISREEEWYPSASTSASEDSQVRPSQCAISWEGAWKLVEYVNVSQGSIVQDVATLTKFPLNDESFQRYTKELERCLDGSPSDFYSESALIEAFKPVQERDKRKWRSRRNETEEVEFSVRMRRNRAGLAPCKFDHGWYPSSNQVKWMDRFAARGLHGAEDFMFWMSGRMQ